mmetsp:Transcript_9410/g.20861  ORF Transcript_9410/g.20861 Transcript_9410/m.20861 type:complete len:89 (-) Transcript_9410:5-271(-)
MDEIMDAAADRRPIHIRSGVPEDRIGLVVATIVPSKKTLRRDNFPEYLKALFKLLTFDVERNPMHKKGINVFILSMLSFYIEIFHHML